MKDQGKNQPTQAALSESEERYRHLVESSPAAMIVHSQGRIVYANRSAIYLAGAEKLEDLLNKPMLDFVHPDYHSIVIERIRQTVEEAREVELIREKFIRLDGKVIDVEVAAIPTTYQQKPATQVVFLDITEWKQAEETLHRRNQELAMLYETSLAITSHLSLEMVLRTVAEKMTQSLEISECTLSTWKIDQNLVETLVDYSMLTPNHTEPRGTSYNLDQYPSTKKVLESGEPIFIHRGDKDADQAEANLMERLNVHTLLMLPLMIGNQVIGLVELIDEVQHRDFTPEEIRLARNLAAQAAIAIDNARLYEQVQKQAEILEERVSERTAELQAANQRLLALSKVKTDFVANVSHELRTPLSSIQLYHALLGSDLEKNSIYIDRLRRETSRLASIIEGLLQLTRLDQEEGKIKPLKININQIASTFASDREPLAASKGLTLVFKPESNLPPVFVDSELIGQALSVLVTNALNYTPSGGQICLSTELSSFQNKDWVGISVCDTGPGIPIEEQPRLFERFYRGSTGQLSRVPGTGLGLSIAKEIADRHHGRIDVESQGIPGKGARFTIWLPANP